MFLLGSLYVNEFLIHPHTHEGQDKNQEQPASICQYEAMLDQPGIVVNTRYLDFSKASDTVSCGILIWKHRHTLVLNGSRSGS